MEMRGSSNTFSFPCSRKTRWQHMCDLSPTQGVSVRVGRNAPRSQSFLRSVRSMKGVSLDAQSSTYVALEMANLPTMITKGLPKQAGARRHDTNNSQCQQRLVYKKALRWAAVPIQTVLYWGVAQRPGTSFGNQLRQVQLLSLQPISRCARRLQQAPIRADNYLLEFWRVLSHAG